MTDYEKGFIHKCEEMGVPAGVAASLLKRAADTILDGSIGRTVQKGDTVGGMAKSLGIPQSSVPDILRENGLTEETARKIRPGQQIYFNTGFLPDPPPVKKPAPVAAAPAPRKPTMSPEERARRVEEMRAENRRRNPNSLESILGRFYASPTNSVSTNVASSATSAR